ncbi:Preprotein translocase subunit SecG [Lysobacter dokdonensis DS-58]|uniref:Protein-export membrane protein SecG n=1 Tax=Lysobacter dokdonensis DS-58 TaxID=1300345 RepID=A0A0A2WKG5_9GAMM|nr:preprotein translocase subunit SecG [Lysobacter dokdonensis]KGQ19197.1 Preprotein translocase subunit SecG [Lysobacter dokdonensis DS-58]
MLMTLLNVLYVLLAVAMIVLILMQRGAGAQAGSGFGAGASATVFGARGAGNFLSKSTKWLAITFFLIALFMGWHFTHASKAPAEAQQKAAAADLGLVSDVPTAPAAAPAQQPANTAVPVAPAANNAVPAAPAPATTVAPK